MISFDETDRGSAIASWTVFSFADGIFSSFSSHREATALDATSRSTAAIVQEPHSALRWLRRFWPWHVMFLAAAVVSVLYEGFYYGVGNNAFQVPLLQSAADPSLYAGDPFVGTFADYVSVFWKSLAALHLHVQWAPVFLVFQILVRYLTIAAFDKILSFFVRNRAFSSAGAMLLSVAQALFYNSPFAADTLLANFFEHTQLANALLLFALAAWMRRRMLLAAVLLGLAANVNAFVSAWGVLALLLAILLRGDIKEPGILRETGLAAAAYLAFAAPELILVAAATMRDAGVHATSFDYRAFLLTSFPFHFSVHYPDLSRKTLFVLAVASGCVAIAARWPRSRELAFLGLGFLAVFVAGIIVFLPYLPANPILLSLELPRAEGILHFLAAFAVISACFTIDSKQKSFGVSLASGAAAIAGLLQGDWLLVFLAISSCYAAEVLNSASARKRTMTTAAISIVVIAAAAVVVLRVKPISADTDHPAKGFMAPLVFLAFLLPGAGAGEFSLLAGAQWALQPWLKAAVCLALLPHLVPGSRLRWWRMAGDSMACIATCVALRGEPYADSRFMFGACAGALIWSGWRSVSNRGDGSRARSAAFLRFAWASAAVIPVTLILLAAARHASAGALTDIPVRREDPWRDVQEWAKQNTPPRTVFLVPMSSEGFEVFSERSAWIDTKRVAGVTWSPAYYWIYIARKQQQVETMDAHAFAAAHNVCYAVILRNNPALTLPAAHWPDAAVRVDYENSQYAVLDLCHSPTSPYETELNRH